MITASGAEGINLKNVRYVHLLEPYWHPVRLAQVIGRARRIRSHDELPPEYRNIETFLFRRQFFLLLALPMQLMIAKEGPTSHRFRRQQLMQSSALKGY